VGLFRAFGMAARRWYLLLPLVLAAVGAAYVAYREMPAVYTASVVHQVNAPHPTAEPDWSAADSDSADPDADSPERIEAPSPEDSYASATTVAGELAAKVQPPRARAPGAQPPYTVTARPDSPLITVRADADSAERALGTVRGVSARLTAQLASLQDQRAVPADHEMRLDTAAPPSVGPPVRTTGIKVFAATLVFGLLLAVVLAAAVERSARRRAELAEGDPDGLLDDSGQDDRPEHDHDPSERVSDGAVGSGTAHEAAGSGTAHEAAASGTAHEAAASGTAHEAAASGTADEEPADRPADPDARPDGDDPPTQVTANPSADPGATGAGTDRVAQRDGDDAPTEVGALSAIMAPRIRRPGPPPPGRPVPPSHPGREAPVRDVVSMRRPVPRGGRGPQLAGPPPAQPRSVGARLAGLQHPLPPRRPVTPPPVTATRPPAGLARPPAPAPPRSARSAPPPAPAPPRPPRSAPPPGARPVPGDAPPAAQAPPAGPPPVQAPPAGPPPVQAPPAGPPPVQAPPAGPPVQAPPAGPPPAQAPPGIAPLAPPYAQRPAKLPNRRPGEYRAVLVNPFGPTDSTTFDSSSLWAPATSPLPGSTGFLPATPLPAGARRTGGDAAEPAGLEMPVSTLAEDDWAEPDEPGETSPPPPSSAGKAPAERAEGPRAADGGDDGFGWSNFDDLAGGTADDGRQAGRAGG